MSQSLNLLDDLCEAIHIAKADIVLAENLGGTLGIGQKRKAIDLLLGFKPKLDAIALALGREIYPVEKVSLKSVVIAATKKLRPPKTAIVRTREKYADSFTAPSVGYKKHAHGLNDSPTSIADENRL